MVRAIIEGRKTQTRRIVADSNTQGNWKPSECDLSTAFVDPGPSPAGNPGPYLKASVTSAALKAHGWVEDDEIRDRLYPRVFPGDQLWGRETFRTGGPMSQSVWYRADEEWNTGAGWTPSIFMPRWASRLTLAVKDVRVERVQDISEADAKAEGAELRVYEEDREGPWIGTVDDAEDAKRATYRAGYQEVWWSIHGADSWEANPWVWVYTFDPVGRS